MGSLVRVQSKTLIFLNKKLYLKYILNGLSFSFIENLSQKSKNVNLVLPQNVLTYLMLHYRLSSVFYATQLVDIFSYEVLSKKANTDLFRNAGSVADSSVLVYNLHSMYSQDRYFVFTVVGGSHSVTGTRYSVYGTLSSIAELFPAAN